MSGALTGKTAIVTGSTGEGMGRQTGWTLAREGASVVLNYGTYRKSTALARKAVAECRRLGGDAIAVRADTRTEAGNRRLVGAAEKAFGPVDVAVANAGGDWIERPLSRLSEREWRKVVDAEVEGAVQLVRAVEPSMRKRGGGRIVLIGWEQAATWPREPFDYAFGKAAREVLNRQLSRSLEPRGIRVNLVSPGYIPYPTNAQAKDLVRHGRAWTRRKRSTTQDVAEAVLWLCSDKAAHVSGAELRVYGPMDA